jgi:hypothetical protein
MCNPIPTALGTGFNHSLAFSYYSKNCEFVPMANVSFDKIDQEDQ